MNLENSSTESTSWFYEEINILFIMKKCLLTLILNCQIKFLSICFTGDTSLLMFQYLLT